MKKISIFAIEYNQTQKVIMKRFFSIILCLATLIGGLHTATAQTSLPKTIHSGPFKSGHIQGIAIDHARNHIYLSYTTMLIKTDLQGNILGSVVGLVGHLGDLTFNPQDGKVYGTLEYKDDSIGKNILKREGSNKQFPNSFYIAIFDGEKIDHQDINPEKEIVVKTVHLQAVYNDYSATVQTPEGEFKHRLGCSGVDGISFGPKFGKSGGKQYLTVAYGVYGETARKDNDYQVLHQYDVSKWDRYMRPLAQTAEGMHKSGPKEPNNIYYAFTGNTNYGIQNLEYDPELKLWWMAVYKGSKREYPNYGVFAVDGSMKPVKQSLKGVPYITKGMVIPLQQRIPSLKDEASGVSGWNFYLGSTGFYPAGNGYYYISHNYANKEGQGSDLHLYRLSNANDKPFVRVE